MDERMDRRIARLALARFRVGGFVGTSIADLAGALGVSKAAIYCHYRSKDALLHRLIDPSWTPSTPASRTTPPRPGHRGNCWAPTWAS
jgi:AcrR family transcriptional regulator